MGRGMGAAARSRWVVAVVTRLSLCPSPVVTEVLGKGSGSWTHSPGAGEAQSPSSELVAHTQGFRVN